MERFWWHFPKKSQLPLRISPIESDFEENSREISERRQTSQQALSEHAYHTIPGLPIHWCWPHFGRKTKKIHKFRQQITAVGMPKTFSNTMPTLNWFTRSFKDSPQKHCSKKCTHSLDDFTHKWDADHRKRNDHSGWNWLQGIIPRKYWQKESVDLTIRHTLPRQYG